MTKTTANDRKRKERERDKAQGLIRRDVKAHVDDWPEIRELELKLKTNRLKILRLFVFEFAFVEAITLISFSDFRYMSVI